MEHTVITIARSYGSGGRTLGKKLAEERIARRAESQKLPGLSMLQTCVQSVVDKDVKLVNIVQVMLVRLVLPCQRRACSLWEYDPDEH